MLESKWGEGGVTYCVWINSKKKKIQNKMVIGYKHALFVELLMYRVLAKLSTE